MLSHLKISQKKQSVDLPLPPGLGIGSKAFERKRSVDILPESICPNQMSRRRKSVDVFWPLEPGPAAKSFQEQRAEADVMPPQATESQEFGNTNSVEIFYTPDFGSPNIKGQRKKSVEIFLKADAGRPTDVRIKTQLFFLNQNIITQYSSSWLRNKQTYYVMYVHLFAPADVYVCTQSAIMIRSRKLTIHRSKKEC